ncbi:unnamed protein product [Moneuplotes crassus]|uniref:Uncharacterized protein n=1 Tax=Euplotes crassus TaxID=5936 RepID=A0AAD1UBI7_EUPCR|nr:unnamed protein product [Moneuplotes crassus]
MSVCQSRLLIDENLTDFCLTSIGDWLKREVHHACNYEFSTKSRRSIELKFKNKYLRDKIITKICCVLFNCSLTQLYEIYSRKKEIQPENILNESGYIHCDQDTNEQASEKQFVVNNVLDQSHMTSGQKSSVAWSDMASSILCSPKPELIENIPKPQSGLGMKPRNHKVMKPTPSKFNNKSSINEFETPERPRSLHREPIRNRLEKLDLVSYREKRSEHIQKHVSRARECTNARNLLTELRKFEVKKNTNSFVEPCSKNNQLNMNAIKEENKFINSTIKYGKPVERSPRINTDKFMQTELRPQTSRKNLNKSSFVHGKPAKTTSYEGTSASKNTVLSRYLVQNYESVLKKGKVNEKKKILERNFNNLAPNSKTSTRRVPQSKNTCLNNTRNMKGNYPKDLALDQSVRDQKKSRNETESNKIQSYIRNANAKIKTRRGTHTSRANMYMNYCYSIDIKDPVSVHSARRNLNTTMGFYKSEKTEPLLARLSRKYKRLSEEHTNICVDTHNFKEISTDQNNDVWQTPKKLNKTSLLNLHGDLQPVIERSTNDDACQRIQGKQKFKVGYHRSKKLCDFIENPEKKPYTARPQKSKFSSYLP